MHVPAAEHFSMESLYLSQLLILSVVLSFSLANSSFYHTPIKPNCHAEERSALLEFKATFHNAPRRPLDDIEKKHNHPVDFKTWMVEGDNGDCCNWDGIECDEHSGYVIGLDAPASGLSGPFNSSNSIFQLVHLQRLDLSYNDFSNSKIPSAISKLSKLTSLDLHLSNFSGQIPSEILQLTNLTSLDLSRNQLTLSNPSLKDLVQSLVKLEAIFLGSVNMSSSIPISLSRLTSLKFLKLYNCELKGQIPPSIANLVSLRQLDLHKNHLEAPIPSLQNLTHLAYLYLGDNNFVGEVASSLHNLTQLDHLDLSFNQFSGEISPLLMSLTKLQTVDISFNKFYGPIPSTISHLKKLRDLFLSSNNLSGKIDLDMLFRLEYLVQLELSFNNFSLLIEPSINQRPKLQLLGLASCNLRGFPQFLHDQDSLRYLDLSSNNISGEVPKWFLNVSKGLSILNLSHNHLNGFEGNSTLLKWQNLSTLDLRFNQLKGSLPRLLKSTPLDYYLAANNKLSGEIPKHMCNLVSLKILDLGNNSLNSKIPSCLVDLVGIGNLMMLSLGRNNFEGRIPRLGKDRCNLVMIDMSYNRLEGSVPRDIRNCRNLEFLNLGNNRIDDVFPYWLGKLPTLSILTLHSNRFHGKIEKPKGGYHFPKLRIIRLSHNSFNSCLPSEYFTGWRAMKVDTFKESQTVSYFGFTNEIVSYRSYYLLVTLSTYHGGYYYSIKLTNKGIDREYEKIQKSLIVIDLSSNNFSEEIPDSIGTLNGLRLLNLSNNMLTGLIPSNLNGLTNLEALDLSFNRLSGEIPQQLTDLIALSYFDVSFNKLTGSIPISRQFNTFESPSYEGNPGLCGFPLSRKCGNVEALPSPSLEKDHASSNSFEIDWRIVSMGYVSGFVIGVSLGMNWIKGWKRVKRAREIKFILN